MRKRTLGSRLIAAPYLVWAAIFFVVPLIIMVYFALTDQNGAIQNRATYAAGVDVVGQVRERQTIAPGKSIKDFILFDRPTRGVETLHLLYPGRRLGGTGLVRVQFPYTWANPEIPDDFKPKP